MKHWNTSLHRWIDMVSGTDWRPGVLRGITTSRPRHENAQHHAFSLSPKRSWAGRRAVWRQLKPSVSISPSWRMHIYPPAPSIRYPLRHPQCLSVSLISRQAWFEVASFSEWACTSVPLRPVQFLWNNYVKAAFPLGLGYKLVSAWDNISLV